MKKFAIMLLVAWGSGLQIVFPQTISTVAGSGIKEDKTGKKSDLAIHISLNSPSDVALDKQGNLYIADAGNNRICRVDKKGLLKVIAGTGQEGWSGDGGPATSAKLNNPVALTLDDTGNIYFADNKNFVIRKINTNGIISIIAGRGHNGFEGDGDLAINAALSYPTDIALDSYGNIYIADYGNFRVRKINREGIIRTIAGNGSYGYSGDGKESVYASIEPSGLAIDQDNNLYVSDFNNQVIRKITNEEIISTVTTFGALEQSPIVEPGKMTSFNPAGIDIDAEGNTYVPEYSKNIILKIDRSGTVTTLAGTGAKGYSGDGGKASFAELNDPTGVAVDDNSGDIYIADRDNNRVRKIAKNKIARK